MAEIEAGAVFEVEHPFSWREGDLSLSVHAADYMRHSCWCPGVHFEPISPEDSGALAEGVGKQILTVVSTHKPGRFPLRVFYTREWEDPDGKRFGNPACRIATAHKFRRLISGYWHAYELESRQAAE